MRLRSLKSWKTTPMERRSSGIWPLGDRGDVAAAHQDLALRGQLLAEDELQEGGLARARGAGEEAELALLDVQGDVGERAATRGRTACRRGRPGSSLRRYGAIADYSERIAHEERVVITSTAGPRCCGYEEVPDPVAGAGRGAGARARLRAQPPRHLDAQRARPAGRVPFPHVLGNDIAGEVAVAAHARSRASRAGQRVMLSPGTSCGRCRDVPLRRGQLLPPVPHPRLPDPRRLRGAACAVPRPNVIPLPDHVAFEEAAAFPLVFLTAWRMLVTRARVRAGRGRARVGGGQRRGHGRRPGREAASARA